MATVDKIIATAKSQVGYHEGRSGGHWNNDQKFSDELPGMKWSDFQAWCATFVCWVFWKTGQRALLPTVSASCDVMGAAWKKAGRWSTYPAIGAQVFFGTPRDLSHTGICIAYNSTSITTIEGNTNSSGSREGDGVYLKVHPRTSPRIIGYGYPRYPEGIQSADPKFAADAPRPKPAGPPPATDRLDRAGDMLREALPLAESTVANLKAAIDNLALMDRAGIPASDLANIDGQTAALKTDLGIARELYADIKHRAGLIPRTDKEARS